MATKNVLSLPKLTVHKASSELTTTITTDCKYLELLYMSAYSYKESFFSVSVFWIFWVTECQLCSWPSAKVTEKETDAIRGDNISINSLEKIKGISE